MSILGKRIICKASMSDKVSMVDCSRTGCPHVHQLNENGQWTIRESLGWMSRRSPNAQPNRKPEQATSSRLWLEDEPSWTVSDSCDRTSNLLPEKLLSSRRHWWNISQMRRIQRQLTSAGCRTRSQLVSQNDKNDSSAQDFHCSFLLVLDHLRMRQLAWDSWPLSLSLSQSGQRFGSLGLGHATVMIQLKTISRVLCRVPYIHHTLCR